MTIVRDWWRRALIGAGVLVVILIVYSFFGRSESSEPSLILSEVITMAQAGNVAAIEVRGDDLTVTTRGGQEFTSRKEEGESILTMLREAGVEIGGPNGVAVEVKDYTGFGSWLRIIITFLPLILFGGILAFFIRMAIRRSK